MQFRAKIKNRTLEFTSDQSKAKLLEYEGSDIIITIDDKPSSNARRFFEGAVIPAIYYQLPHSGWRNFKECREAIKLEFLPSYTTTIKGERLKYPRSTDTLSKSGFADLIEHILNWMAEQGMELPDHIDYNAWNNSAPAKGEEYPPVKRMRLAYFEVTGRLK